MSDDIVARLRVLNHHAKKLAENESLHDLYRDAFTRCEDLTLEAAAEIERLRELSGDAGKLREERDEVRQSYCSLMEAYRGGDGRVTANKLGWGYLFPRRPKKEDGK